MVFFNLEMPGAEIVRRQIMACCGVTDPDRFAGMGNSLAEYDALMGRFHMHNAQRTVAKIEAAVASIGDVRLVIVDHLGKIKAPGTKSPYERVSTVIVDLQAMAAALDVPVMLLCHLNRADNKSPADEVSLSSLRDSGVIEDQSDYVLGLWWPNYTEEVERQAAGGGVARRVAEEQERLPRTDGLAVRPALPADPGGTVAGGGGMSKPTSSLDPAALSDVELKVKL